MVQKISGSYAKQATQKICRRAREEEVRDTISKIWNQPSKARFYLETLSTKNKDIYEFEEQLCKF